MVLALLAVIADTTISGSAWLPQFTVVVVIWACLLPKSELTPWVYAFLIGCLLDGADPGSRYFHGLFFCAVCGLLRLCRHWLYPQALLSFFTAALVAVGLHHVMLGMLLNQAGFNLWHMLLGMLLSACAALLLAGILRPLTRKWAL